LYAAANGASGPVITTPLTLLAGFAMTVSFHAACEEDDRHRPHRYADLISRDHL
jgi:hypothetical protein